MTAITTGGVIAILAVFYLTPPEKRGSDDIKKIDSR
jgi:hypothetical protein